MKTELEKLFLFANFLSSNFDYFDNTSEGDMYTCKQTGGKHTQEKVYSQWLKFIAYTR